MKSCKICQSKRVRFYKSIDSPYVREEKKYCIYECLTCGHGYAEGDFKKSTLESIYSNAFFNTSQQIIDGTNSPIMKNAKNRALWLRKKASGKLLDVGCGNGAFLLAAREYFDVTGLEFSKPAVETAKKNGLKVERGDFILSEISSETYDVISFWDVLSSFADINLAFSKMNRMLADNGIIIATIPLKDSLFATFMGENWPMFVPPVNRQYFTKRSLETLAVEHQMKIEFIELRGKYVSSDFILRKLFSLKNQTSIFFKLMKKIPNLNLKLNTFDIATVILKKQEMN